MIGNEAPPQETMRSALELACRAPSVQNSQPWRWRLAEHSAHLYIDRSRLLPLLDPTGRELVISCGAVLHHARIAFAATGWRALVHRLPNPALPDHLASIEFRKLSEVDPAAVTLAAVAADRYTDRRPFLPDPVPVDLLASLRGAAEAEDCRLTFALDKLRRRELEWAIDHADSVQRALPEYFEQSTPDFNLVAEGELPVPVLDDGAVLAVLATRGDSFESWLAAGEALSAVLLGAAKVRLAACTLSQLSEVAASRTLVRDKVLDGTGEPQLAVRLGWPVTPGSQAPVTPRRPLADSIEPLLPFRST
jgi:hypothetical protein